jgi:hypothetical protein
MAGRECRMNNDEFALLLFRHKVLLVAPGAHASDALAPFSKAWVLFKRVTCLVESPRSRHSRASLKDSRPQGGSQGEILSPDAFASQEGIAPKRRSKLEGGKASAWFEKYAAVNFRPALPSPRANRQDRPACHRRTPRPSAVLFARHACPGWCDLDITEGLRDDCHDRARHGSDRSRQRSPSDSASMAASFRSAGRAESGIDADVNVEAVLI